jgi:hypothetical protein
MTQRKCKFCHCSERRPCRLVAVKDAPDLEPHILAGGIALVPADVHSFLVPCAWLTEDICTNPACVEKGYIEARDLEIVIAIAGLVEQGLVEFSDDSDDPQLLLTEKGRMESARMRWTA